MMSIEQSSVVSAILKIVSESPQHSASGSRIAFSLSRDFPDFHLREAGFQNLRGFIRSCVPDIVEAPKRAGLDVIYTLRQTVDSTLLEHVEGPEDFPKPKGPASLLLNNPRAWKTFASPMSTSKLFVRPGGTALHVSSTPERDVHTSGWIRVDPLTGAVLSQIAREFLEQLPELYRPSLLETLKQPKWWIPFFEVLGSLGLKSKWVAFRRRRIVDEFTKAVAFGASASAATTQALGSGQQPRKEASSPSSKHERLRAAIIRAVEQMSTVELRALIIPVGYLADAFHLNE
jgi:hypothetical protein